MQPNGKGKREYGGDYHSGAMQNRAPRRPPSLNGAVLSIRVPATGFDTFLTKIRIKFLQPVPMCKLTPNYFMKNAIILPVVAFFCLVSAAFAQSKVEPPVPVRTVPPEYPTELRRDGVSGVVTLKCQIDEKGDVTGAEVEKSTNSAFEASAIAAVRKWKFKPAKQDGAPVSIRVSIPIKFVSES